MMEYSVRYVRVKRSTFRHILQDMQLNSVITSLKGLQYIVSL